MKSETLEAFAWCPDGFTREDLSVGDVRDFGAATDGLTEAKMIRPVTVVEKIVAAVVAAVVEPEPEVIEPVVVVPEPEPAPVVVAPTPHKHKRHR